MALEITESAISRFRELATPPTNLPRIEIAAGGCNGFEKRFTLDYRRDDDITIDIGDGLAVLVDPMSHDLLGNSRVDFKRGIDGSYFTVEIPEATSTCGCGTSFSL